MTYQFKNGRDTIPEISVIFSIEKTTQRLWNINIDRNEHRFN